MIDEILKEKIINRQFYLDQIENFLDSNLIKVIVWQRRVGKSYILKLLIQKLVKQIPKSNFFYINKEDLTWDYLQDYKDLYDEFKKFLKQVDEKFKIFVWIDEIQTIDGWEKFVTHLQTKYKNIEIFITWSNSDLLSWDLATRLTWRYVEIQVYPLDLEEFSIFKRKKVSKWLFLDYLKYWWLPGIFEVKYNDKAIYDYLRWVYNTILLKDITGYYNVKNIDFMESLYKFVFSNIWHIFSAKSISDYLKSQKIRIWVDTILTYLQYGIKAFLIHLVKSEDPRTKKYFEIYNKYYVWDLGLRNAIVGVNFAKDISGLLENYVFLILKKYWYDVKIWRLKVYDKSIKDYKNVEIDFVAEKDWKIKYFQVATSVIDEHTRERELFSLKVLKDNWEKYIIHFDGIDYGEIDGIKFVNILDIKKIL